MCLVNLFAFRTPHPASLLDALDPIGPRTDEWILRAAEEADLVIAAWGASGSLMGRDSDILEMVPDIRCLGTTQMGYPRHPLYLKRETSIQNLDAC